MIEVKLDELLAKHGHSFYWLSKKTHVSYTTLWRLKKGNALGINFATLVKICDALECQPGDILEFKTTHKQTSKTNSLERSKGAGS